MQTLPQKANLSTKRIAPLLVFRGFVYLAVPLLILSNLQSRWGSFDYTSSLHPNNFNNSFTGLDALRQQSIMLCPFSCIVGFALLGIVAMKGSAFRVSKLKGLNAIDILLLVIMLLLGIVWLRIMLLAASHEKASFFVSSVWYKDLLPAFWQFACVLGISVVAIVGLVIGAKLKMMRATDNSRDM
jgi:hypothetical protein